MFARRRGFTLVELLVVITIIVGITALAIGVAVPDVGQRRIREASRQLNAFIQGAKARAAETRRPVAVVIEPGNGQAAFVLKYAEVPPPYAGDTLHNSFARIVSGSKTGPQPGGEQADVALPDFGWLGATPAQDLIRVGDLIQFNHQGHRYPITAIDRGNARLRIRARDSTSRVLHPENVPLRYQVSRLPIPSPSSAMELPEGTVIDLNVSGPEGGVFAAGTVAIEFSPGGSVSRCWNGVTLCPASRPIYLLIGNPEGVGANTTPQPYANLRNLETIWVAVNHQTGLVTSVENRGGVNRTAAQLNRARDYARKRQSLGGRSG